MNYQELIDACKNAYAEKSLNGAYRYWEKIHNLLTSKLDVCQNEKERFETYKEFHQYMEQFTDDEVYDITDYGKARAYRQMEIERSSSMNYKSLYALTKDENMKVLDDFLEFYEWGVVDSDDEKGKYCIYDIQTGEYLDTDENDGNMTLEQVITRIVGRVIDYDRNEREWDDECVDDDTIKYFETLYTIATQYRDSDDKYEEKWLQQFRAFIDDFKQCMEDKSICLVCGKKKEDYQSAYCDECWEEEKERLGISD